MNNAQWQPATAEAFGSGIDNNEEPATTTIAHTNG